MKRETENRKGKRGGLLTEGPRKRPPRVDVPDSETSTPLAPKTQRRNRRQISNCGVEGKHKKYPLPFAITGKVASCQGSKNSVGGFEDSIKVLK